MVGHTVQRAAPVLDTKEPAAHGVQDEAPPEAAKEPGEQGVPKLSAAGSGCRWMMATPSA